MGIFHWLGLSELCQCIDHRDPGAVAKLRAFFPHSVICCCCIIFPCDFSLKSPHPKMWGFPGGSAVKNPPANAGDVGLIPGLRRSPGEGNGSPLNILAWEIPGHRSWQAVVHGVPKSRTGLSD